MRYLLQRLAFTPIAAFLISPLSAQVLPFHSYGQSDGLLSESVLALFQDSRGYLWVGSGEGVSVYDGYAFTNYTTRQGLALSFVTSIAESKITPGTMWFGTLGGGISRFQNGLFTTIILDSSAASNEVHALLTDHSGTLWCATDDGLYFINDNIVTQLQLDVDPFKGSELVQSTDGTIWIGAKDRLILYSPNDSMARTVNLRDGKPTRTVQCMFADHDNNVWVGTSDSLVMQFSRGEKIMSRKIDAGVPQCILEDQQNTLWLGTAAGLVRIRKSQIISGQFVRYTTDNGLPTNSVTLGLCDKEDNLWFRDEGKGIFKLTERNLYTFQLNGISSSYNNTRATTDSNGHFWVPYADGIQEVWQGDEGQWQTHLHRDDLGPLKASHRCIVYDNHGLLWMDCGFGIRGFEVQPQGRNHSKLKLVREFRNDIDLPRGSRLFFLFDSQGTLWLSLTGKGVARIDVRTSPKVIKIYNEDDGLPSVDTRAIYEDRTGNLWFGGVHRGIGVLPVDADTNTRLQEITVADGLPDGRIRSFLQDNEGRMWIGTRYGGHAVYSEGKIQTITLDDGLINQAIWAACSDTSGRIWCATQLGLQAIDSRTLKPYPVTDEMYGRGVISCGISKNRFLWFISGKSFSVYELEQDHSAPTPPPVYVTRFLVNGLNEQLTGLLEFPHDQNTCTVEYVAVSFREGKALRYQYRLKNVDEDWRPLTQQRSVTYATLRPGVYTFEVRTITAQGIPGLSNADLTFTIMPQLWARWWFVTLALFVFFGTLFSIFRYRHNVLSKEKSAQQTFSRRLIELQEAERKRIAGELHDGIGQHLLIIKNRSILALNSAPDPSPAHDQLNEISTIASQAINETRAISYNLRPYQLDRLGLTKAIHSIIATASLNAGTRFLTFIDDIDKVFPEKAEINVYRIVQEAINNILKHARATEATIRISRNASEVLLDIEDNGAGFDTDTFGKHGSEQRGLGLTGIAERVKMLDGSLAIDSSPGHGTKLRIHLPVAKEAI